MIGVGIVLTAVAAVWAWFMRPTLHRALPRSDDWRAWRRLDWSLQGLCFTLAVCAGWALWEWWVVDLAGFQGFWALLFSYAAFRAWPPASIELRVGDLRARADAVEDRTEWGK